MAEKIIADALDTALARHYEQLGDAEREKQAVVFMDGRWVAIRGDLPLMKFVKLWNTSIATVYRKSSRNRWKISHHLLLITVRYSSRTPLSLVVLSRQRQSKHLSR